MSKYTITYLSLSIYAIILLLLAAYFNDKYHKETIKEIRRVEVSVNELKAKVENINSTAKAHAKVEARQNSVAQCGPGEAFGRKSHTCYAVPVPGPSEYLFCWDSAAEDQPHCNTYSGGGYTFWSPPIWQYVPDGPMPTCGVWPASFAEHDPLPECCLTTQADFVSLPTKKECASDPKCDENNPTNYRHCSNAGETFIISAS